MSKAEATKVGGDMETLVMGLATLMGSEEEARRLLVSLQAKRAMSVLEQSLTKAIVALERDLAGTDVSAKITLVVANGKVTTRKVTPMPTKITPNGERSIVLAGKAFRYRPKGLLWRGRAYGDPGQLARDLIEEGVVSEETLADYLSDERGQHEGLLTTLMRRVVPDEIIVL